MKPKPMKPKPNKPISLTRKQKAFADALLNNPKLSGTQAALQTYGKPDKPTTRRTAETIAFDNMRKPNIQAYLGIHADTASNTMMEVMQVSREFAKNGDREGASYAAVAVQSAKDVLDRTYGKAVQQVETRSQVMVINIDLTTDEATDTEAA